MRTRPRTRPFVVPLLAPAACGTAAGGAPGQAGSDGASSDDASDDACPVTLAHRHGETTIPERPERVVAVGFNDSDVVVALGVVPVGERSLMRGLDASGRPWFREALGDAGPPQLLGAEELDHEVVASLDPDPIVGMYSGMTSEEYETLSAIAPTVAQPDDFIDWGVPWRIQLERTGQALGRVAEAEAILTEVEAAFEEARAALPEADGASLTFASAMTPELYADTADDLRARFFADLGLEISEAVDGLTGEEFYAQISREQADLLADDVLVVYADRGAFTGDPATVPEPTS